MSHITLPTKDDFLKDERIAMLTAKAAYWEDRYRALHADVYWILLARLDEKKSTDIYDADRRRLFVANPDVIDDEIQVEVGRNDLLRLAQGLSVVLNAAGYEVTITPEEGITSSPEPAPADGGPSAAAPPAQE